MFNHSFYYRVYSDTEPDAALQQPNATRIVKALTELKKQTLTKQLAKLHTQQAELMQLRLDYLEMGDCLGRAERLHELTLMYADVTEQVDTLLLQICKL